MRRAIATILLLAVAMPLTGCVVAGPRLWQAGMVRLPPLPLPLALFVREAALAAIWRRFAALRCSWPAPLRCSQITAS